LEKQLRIDMQQQLDAAHELEKPKLKKRLRINMQQQLDAAHAFSIRAKLIVVTKGRVVDIF
jgi:hypothetical protein